MSAEVRLDVDGSVATLIISNLERRNAMTVAMWQTVPSLCDRINSDPSIRAVVIRGDAQPDGQTVAFAAGADISEFETVRKGAAGARNYDAIEHAGLTAIQNIEQPTIAAIHGFCFGGGVAISVSADLRYAADDALMAIPAANLGLGYPAAGLAKLVDLLGPATTKELFYRARRFDAAEALQVGLVNEVVPKANLDAHVAAIAADIATKAPLTLRQVKTVVGELLRGHEADHDVMQSATDACFESADYGEGVAAFLEKRRPDFTGR
jgi:enoyl-CoA hydratase